MQSTALVLFLGCLPADGRAKRRGARCAARIGAVRTAAAQAASAPSPPRVRGAQPPQPPSESQRRSRAPPRKSGAAAAPAASETVHPGRLLAVKQVRERAPTAAARLVCSGLGHALAVCRLLLASLADDYHQTRIVQPSGYYHAADRKGLSLPRSYMMASAARLPEPKPPRVALTRCLQLLRVLR